MFYRERDSVRTWHGTIEPNYERFFCWLALGLLLLISTMKVGDRAISRIRLQFGT